MKNILAATTLALVSNFAAADGFAPWETRAVPLDAPATASTTIAPAGFAPWRDHTVLREMPDAELRMSDVEGSAFRPWS